MSELIPLVDAAAMCGVHKITLRRWIAAGRLDAYRVGPRLLRVRVADVQALAAPVPTASSR